MILPDVNVLVYAHHEDSVDHVAYRDWWETVVNGPGPFAIVDMVLSGLVRVMTHPKVFAAPMRTGEAVAAAEQIRSRPNCLAVRPGDGAWATFCELCRRTSAKGNAVPDAYLAAIAIESGSELVTTDRGFSRYPDLRWRHPLD